MFKVGDIITYPIGKFRDTSLITKLKEYGNGHTSYVTRVIRTTEECLTIGHEQVLGTDHRDIEYYTIYNDLIKKEIENILLNNYAFKDKGYKVNILGMIT